MRKPRVFRPEAALPRMSWAPANLYNLIARSQTPILAGQTGFVGVTTTQTMYQQRWRAKRFLRGYHGDHIPERRFKRWFLPTHLPSFQNPAASGSKTPRAGGMFAGTVRKNVREAGGNPAEEEGKMPIANLFVREVERRLDTIVFRSCFARSIYDARGLVVQGHVKLNGVTITDPGKLLEPSDMVSLKPTSIPMLALGAAKVEAEEKARKRAAVRSQANRQRKRAQREEASQAVTEADAVEGEEGGEVKAKEEKREPGSKKEVRAADQQRQPAESTDSTKPKRKPLPPGVLPFELPRFAAPHLFIPPYLEVSFTTCSAIYMRHPTLLSKPAASATSRRNNNDRGDGAGAGADSTPALMTTTDIPSPYPANGELFSLAWEYYARNSPRVRGEARRVKTEAATGRNGFETQRKKDEWKKMVAVRKGWLRRVGNQFKKVDDSSHPQGSIVLGKGRQRKRGYRGTARIHYRPQPPPPSQPQVRAV